MPFKSLACRRSGQHPTKARAGQIRPRRQLPEPNSVSAEKLGVRAQHSGAAPKDEAANPNDVKHDRAAWTLQKARLGFGATSNLSSMRTSAMSATGFSRRSLLKSAALGAAGAALDLGALNRAFAAADLTVGIVYVGARDDFGWNQAHAVAIKSLKEVPGVKVVEEENVPETDAVSKSMESMINLDGAGLILATSFGYYHALRRRPGEEVSGRPVPPRGAAVEQGQGSQERRLLFRLSQSGALRQRRRRRPVDQIQQDRLRRGEADRERAQQHQFGPARSAFGQSRTRQCR